MIVMMIAKTPSLKASRRPLFIKGTGMSLWVLEPDRIGLEIFFAWHCGSLTGMEEERPGGEALELAYNYDRFKSIAQASVVR